MSDTYKRKQKSKLSNNLQKNIHVLQDIYKDCSDIVFRKIRIGKSHEACIIFVKGLVNVEEMDDNVLSPLMKTLEWSPETLIDEILPISNVKQLHTYDDCVSQLSAGNQVILIENSKRGIAVFLKKTNERSIEEPMAEQVVRGPREGFIENLTVNISLLRKRVKTPRLKTLEMEIGSLTKTKVVITYIKDIAKTSLIKEVCDRLGRIKIDGVLDSHVIEELIEDNPYSPFPQMLVTERPDVVTAQLLEGRAAIFVDGSPFVLVVPTTFFSLYQSAEDYYLGYIIATMTRWLRYIFLFLSLLLPSLYVVITTYHQEMVPTALLLKIMASREEVPFPIFIEVLIMEITFEALREAGLRLPKQVGSAVSIVGALVIGESAVAAGIVSAPVVIVVALTGIASFTIPKHNVASTIRLLRFPLILIGSIFGMLGVMLGTTLIIIHLCSLRSFGEPYLSPLIPITRNELEDTMVRAPWWKLDRRSKRLAPKNVKRQSKKQKPSPNN